jgi:hypothetical protein
MAATAAAAARERPVAPPNAATPYAGDVRDAAASSASCRTKASSGSNVGSSQRSEM